MLEVALLSSSVAVATLTPLLFAVGRRPLAGRPFWWVLAVILIAASLGWVLALSLVPAGIGTAIGFVALVGPRRWYAVGAMYFGALAVAASVYGMYLVQATFMLSRDPISLALGIILLAIELGAMGLILASTFEMVDALCTPAETPPSQPPPDRWPVVCLQVPTYNEPPDLVIETIRSLVVLDYPALRVQVIDNNTTDEALWRPVEAECGRLRGDGHAVDFIHLPEWPGFKAGALNWGRAHLDADVEIVGVIDADYVVEPQWLRATVPHFGVPSVAFVQTPQDYRAWETSAFYRACYVGFAYFFRVGMVSRAHRNSIIFAGTMGLIRRDVLDEVGGWDERIITEDAEISLRVLARGYRSVYVPHAYGRGIMPLTYEGIRKQRFRWAFGGIQILRRHWRTIMGPRSGLSLGQRYDHLVGGLWWFNDALTLLFALFVGAAAVGAVTGRPFLIQRLTPLGVVLPIVFIGLNLVRYLWALRATTGASPALAFAGLRVNLSLSWVIALACIRGLTQERGVFLRTPKFRGSAAVREIRLVWAESALGLAAVSLLILVIGRVGLAPTAVVLGTLLGWVVLIYGSATAFALGDPTRAPIGDVLRQKMALEIAPRIGRVAHSRPARAGLAAAIAASLALVAAIASESGRAPVQEFLFPDLPGLAAGSTVAGARPSSNPDVSASPSPGFSASTGGGSSTEPGATAGAGGSTRASPVAAGGGSTGPPVPGATPAPTVAPTLRPTPGPPGTTPPPAATPIPRPSPSLVLPTPSTLPSPPTGVARTPPPHPSPSPPAP